MITLKLVRQERFQSWYFAVFRRSQHDLRTLLTNSKEHLALADVLNQLEEANG